MGYVKDIGAIIAAMAAPMMERELSKAKYRKRDYSDKEKARIDEYNRTHFPEG